MKKELKQLVDWAIKTTDYETVESKELSQLEDYQNYLPFGKRDEFVKRVRELAEQGEKAGEAKVLEMVAYHKYAQIKHLADIHKIDLKNFE